MSEISIAFSRPRGGFASGGFHKPASTVSRWDQFPGSWRCMAGIGGDGNPLVMFGSVVRVTTTIRPWMVNGTLTTTQGRKSFLSDVLRMSLDTKQTSPTTGRVGGGA